MVTQHSVMCKIKIGVKQWELWSLTCSHWEAILLSRNTSFLQTGWWQQGLHVEFMLYYRCLRTTAHGESLIPTAAASHTPLPFWAH